MISGTYLLFQIAGIGIIIALMNSVLKQMGKEDISNWITLVGVIIVLVIVVDHLANLFQQIKSVFLFQMIIGGF
ncbi:stage III sporulation protein AC [Salirhabdus salicampi]|uniref:stage III sporulation protein AC n=1 Tax=Salirhabdus salicampi TaxID=476102 RepID=UPI0020C4EF24|nr:stage III sporulation protein AC [Salirhabdus salicampi]MCP8616825.1 stage III sporulation protein AC [Salirhabdus salicampi]